MSIRVRAAAAATAVAAITLAVAGCSSSSGGDDDALQFYLSGDTSQGSAFTKMAKKYTDETGTKVEVVDVPYDDLTTKVNQMVAAGKPPALARVGDADPTWKGKLIDLSAIATKDGVTEDLLSKQDGKAYLLPTDLTAVGLFINTDLFDAAGVKYPGVNDTPWTWDEYITALTTVKQAGKARYGMVMDHSSHRLQTMAYQFGSNGFVEGPDRKFTTDDAMKTALTRFVSLNDDKIIPKSVWLSGEDPSAMFKSGQVAAYFSGSWQIADFTANIKNFAWKAVPMPTQARRSTNLGTNYIAAFQGSGQETEASAFIDWLYAPAHYTELSQLGGFLPVEEGLSITYSAGQDAFDNFQVEISKSDPIASLSMKQGAEKALNGSVGLGDPLKTEVTKVINGEETVDQAVQATLDAFDKAYN